MEAALWFVGVVLGSVGMAVGIAWALHKWFSMPKEWRSKVWSDLGVALGDSYQGVGGRGTIDGNISRGQGPEWPERGEK